MVPKFFSKIPVGYLKSSETQVHLNIFKVDPFSTVILSFLKRERECTDCLTSLTFNVLKFRAFLLLKRTQTVENDHETFRNRFKKRKNHSI